MGRVDYKICNYRKKGSSVVNNIVQILMRRDGNTEEEARKRILECREALENGDDEAIQDYLGLEDDYIFDILD